MAHDFYADAQVAFDRLREAARVLFADPANREKIKRAQEATTAYQVLHRLAVESVGIPGADVQ